MSTAISLPANVKCEKPLWGNIPDDDTAGVAAVADPVDSDPTARVLAVSAPAAPAAGVELFEFLRAERKKEREARALAPPAPASKVSNAAARRLRGKVAHLKRAAAAKALVIDEKTKFYHDEVYPMLMDCYRQFEAHVSVLCERCGVFHGSFEFDNFGRPVKAVCTYCRGKVSEMYPCDCGRSNRYVDELLHIAPVCSICHHESHKRPRGRRGGRGRH